MKDEAYGVIIFAEDKDSFRYLLLQHQNGGHYGFPKGHAKEGETPEQSAFRELKEETGLKRKDLRIIDGVTFEDNYSYEEDGETVYKSVYYYLATTKETYDQVIKIKIDKKEHRGYLWAPFRNAKVLMRFENAQILLNRVNAKIVGQDTPDPTN